MDEERSIHGFNLMGRRDLIPLSIVPAVGPGFIPKEDLKRRSALAKSFGHLGIIIVDCQIRRGPAIYMIAPGSTGIVLDHNGDEDLHFLSPSRQNDIYLLIF